MERYKKEFMSTVDVSKRELQELKEAFKKDQFKQLFKEYVDEVNDPENQALYEKELIQLEKERGVESTFLRPSPGYVIKTSVENSCQAYINVCYNEKIERPSSVQSFQGGQIGSNWSVPHVFGKGRLEMNKDGVEILVYDVLFHPMALDLAHRDPKFKELVNDTAMTAVEDGDRVKLDRRNARVAKPNFVGGKFPCILRKKSRDGRKEDAWEMPGYPYPPVETDPEPVVKELPASKTDDVDGYTTPNYVVKERKGVDISEFRLSKDAKMMATIPEALVVEIPLPLLRSAAEASLDVRGKCLSLLSEEPAKYRLEVSLPYFVDDDNGSATFDKDRKILTVTLPVLRKKYEHDFHREDSGIDSDVTHNDQSCRSSSEEELACFNADESPDAALGQERLSEEVKDEFLDSSRAYSVPTSTVRMKSDKCFVVLHVKNIDPASVHHQFWSSEGVWIKFSSLGGGMFPSHYAFCLGIPKGLFVDRRSLRIEVWDNNLICSMRVHTASGKPGSESSCRTDKCLVGVDPENLSEAKVIREPDDVSEDEREDSDDDEDDFRSPRRDSDVRELSMKMREALKLQKEPSDDVFEDDLSPGAKEVSQMGQPTDGRIVNSTEEASASGPGPTAEDCDNHSKPEVDSKSEEKNESKNKTNCKPQKTRALSESSVPTPQRGKRSILKGSRSLSECHADESGGADWSSQESSESPDDHHGSKKTVRFSDVVSKKIFRANSSILGQRKKNEKKSRNRKKAAERRMSESEAETEGEEISSVSETSSVSDVSDVSADSSDDGSPPAQQVESNKHHRRRGSKNRRKNAASQKQNYLLNRDL